MRDWDEYEFILPDGSCRYEMIDLAVRTRPQIWAFKRMHGAVAAWPIARSEANPQFKDKLIRRLARERDGGGKKVDPGSSPG